MAERLTRENQRATILDGAVLVARPSRWGNPFVVVEDKDGWVAQKPDDRWGVMSRTPSMRVEAHHLSRELARAIAVSMYRVWLEHTADGRAVRDAARATLRGKDLVCYCKPGEACHADVLLEVANG